MFKMIKTDWLGMKCYWIRGLIIPLGICLIGFIDKRMLIPMLSFFMLSFSVNPFAVEEKGKLDNLYLTLPVSRKNIVRARFGLSVLMQIIGLVFGTLATILFAEFSPYKIHSPFYIDFKADFNTLFFAVTGSLLFYAIMNLSTFPFLFKMGYAKGRALGFYVPVGAAFAIVMGSSLLFDMNESFRIKFLETTEWAMEHTRIVGIIMLGATILIFSLSVALSQRLYARREF